MYPKNYFLPLFIFGGIALLALFFYLWTGQALKDQSLSELKFQPQVQSVQQSDEDITITCENGKSYRFVATSESLNIAALKSDKCSEQ